MNNIKSFNEVRDRAFELEQLITFDIWPCFKAKIKPLGDPPLHFLWLKKRKKYLLWLGVREQNFQVMAQFEENSLVKEYRELQKNCVHRFDTWEETLYPWIERRKCLACGKSETRYCGD